MYMPLPTYWQYIPSVVLYFIQFVKIVSDCHETTKMEIFH